MVVSLEVVVNQYPFKASGNQLKAGYPGYRLCFQDHGGQPGCKSRRCMVLSAQVLEISDSRVGESCFDKLVVNMVGAGIPVQAEYHKIDILFT